MGNNEEGKLCKPEKSPSPPTDQKGIHVYPDWAMMQAYYGPRFAVPPYLNSAVGSPHTPLPYMWVPPQSMVPPCGVPYAAFYAHGGVYGHPRVSTAGTAFSTDISVQSSGKTEGGSMKKLKGDDENAISTCNGNTDSGEHGTDRSLSERTSPLLSSDVADDSSDGINGVAAEAGQSGMKRSLPGSPNNAEDTKAQKKGNSIASMPNELWLLNERELKTERRRQSNRESARRSRLRKQADAEQLALKVQTLATENTTLKSKINEFMSISEKLKLENAKLMEKIKEAQTEDENVNKIDDCTANLLERVNEIERVNENNRKSRAKLQQLLDAIASPRADAIAAT